MPVCKRCGCAFPNRLLIEGKIRVIGKRKFCLACSPWGLHNTRNLCLPHPSSSPRTCESCGRVYIFSHRKGHTTTRCNSCLVNTRRFRLKERIVRYLGRKCVTCGYSRSIVALQCHHRNALEKEFTI